jgi:hypothetical protein
MGVSQFAYVEESEDFLTLFGHRGGFIWANHPKPGQRPEWQTEEKHLLTDRQILQASYLYGVRFGAATPYLLVDVDAQSSYHPNQDPFAIGRLVAALQLLGLFAYVAVTSSYSGGLHLYFPFPLALPSWAIAQSAAVLLENAGFALDPGQLEIFPNVRHQIGSNYLAHRLPLQSGSYLVNEDWQPRFSSHAAFVAEWRGAANKNEISSEAIAQVLRQVDRKSFKRIKGSAAKFLNDLNAEIEPGWTGFGQTQRILGKIAIREYVFFHAIWGGAPLTGEKLAGRICDVAESLPGFKQWCRHDRDLARCCRDWAKSVEASPRYYPYGGEAIASLPPPKSVEETWNRLQASNARERIRLAMSQLEAEGTLPIGIRARAIALQESAGVSVTTLYKNRDIWHPKTPEPAPSELLHPIEADMDEVRSPEPAPSELLHPTETISFSATDSAPQGRESVLLSDQAGGTGGNSTDDRAVLRAMVAASIKQGQQASQPKRLIDLDHPPSPPPDEQYFRQFLIRGDGTA